MTRKDSEKDSERPHYYSQFWLDVAAGRRIIGAPKLEEGEAGESDSETLEVVPQHRAAQVSEAETYDDGHVASNGYAEQVMHPVAEPLATPEEFIEPQEDALDLVADAADETDYQDAAVDDTDIPDMDLNPIEEGGEDEDFFEDEGEDDEDDDVNWGRGRKKAKPTRPVKPPVKKPGKRDTRRGY